jgi:hypothetical protein
MALYDPAPPVMDIASQINAATERMIAIQIEGYPKGWTPQEYRETAIKHLFGAAAVGVMNGERA